MGKRAGPPRVSSFEGETVRSYGVPEVATLACRGLTRLMDRAAFLGVLHGELRDADR